MHRGYFAMMLNLALAAVLTWMIKEGRMKSTLWKVLLTLVVAWISFSVMQTGSKNGILTLVLLYFIFAL